MLNALPTPTPATGQPAKLLPSLAAEPTSLRAASEARQGFAALMQQQADLHLADLRSADLKSADLKQADMVLARARNTDSRPAEPAPARSTTYTAERSAQRQDDSPAAARATATSGSAAKPAEHAAARAAGQAPDNSAARADAGQAPATADAAAAAAADTADTVQRPPDDTPPVADAAADPALADDAAAVTQAAVPRRGRGAGLPGAATADGLPPLRLPRTAATEATAAAARLAAALAPQAAADAADAAEADSAQAGEPSALDGDAPRLATAEPGATPPNPDPATLQPWLQAQAMVTHWRPVGDGADPGADTDPALAATPTLDALATAEPALAERGAQRTVQALAADRRAADAATQALGTAAADAQTQADAITEATTAAITAAGAAPAGALPGTTPALADGPRAAAADLRRASDRRTPVSPATGQGATWRPEAEQAGAGGDAAADTKPAADLPGPAAVDSKAQATLPPPQLPAGAAPATPGAADSGLADPTLAPTASALLAAGGGAGRARGLAETAGTRSGSDRPGATPGTTRAEGRSRPGLDSLDDTAGAGSPRGDDSATGPRTSGADATPGQVRTATDVAGERPGPQPNADARAEARLTGAARASDTPLATDTDPTRAVAGALPATAGVQAPAQRTEAPGRADAQRAEALLATAPGGPAAASPTLPQGGAPVAQVNTAFAPQLAAAAAPAQAEARIAVPLDSPDFAPALGAQISLFTRDGVQTARLQLNPAEMGPISVQIALDGSAARVDFQADVAATREVIEASLPALAGALQDAGLTLAGGGVFQHAPGHQPQPEGQAAQQGRSTGRADNAPAAHLAEAAAPVVVRSRGLVDLVA